MTSSLSRGRRLSGWIAAPLAPVLLGLALHRVADTDHLPLAELVLLTGVVLVALVGGYGPAILAATTAFLALNYWFTPPVGTLTIRDPANLLTLVLFIAIAVGVGAVVHRAAQRAVEAARARSEADTLSTLSRSVLHGDDTAEAVCTSVRDIFGQDAVTVLRADGDAWQVVASAGPALRGPGAATGEVRIDDRHLLLLAGPALTPAAERGLESFAVQAGLVLEYRRLREREQAEATATALLRAVSHDLRTPLATMRTAVDGLVDDVAQTADDRAELTAALATSSARLESLIDDLLDLSRLQAGLLRPVLRELSLEEVLPLAVAGHPADAVELELDESAPLVRTDPGLLERVVANLVANAVRVSDGAPVRVRATVDAERIEIAVVDHGPGLAPDLRERMFEPFQRLGDTSLGGLGLGLAVAQGLTEALGGRLDAEDTPGGGLTMLVRLGHPREATQ